MLVYLHEFHDFSLMCGGVIHEDIIIIDPSNLYLIVYAENEFT